MIVSTYTRYEAIRTFRNRRFFVFSLIFPLVLYLIVAGSNRHTHLQGIPFPLYYMAGMVTFGTMAAILAGGARIALERTVGWTRQIRITPLPTRTYFRAKVLTGYMMAVISLIVLYAAGLSMGVHLKASGWVMMTVLILVGLIPFAAMGILLGHLLTPDSMGPALGGITTLFALLGGAYGPLVQGGALHAAVKLLPSYWLVQAAHAGLTGHAWPIEGWIVIAVWTVAMVRLARIAYTRDTGRV